MGTAAWVFEGTDLFGQFSDAGAVADGLKSHHGNALGSLFAIVLLDAALVGANAVSLATTYTLGDTFKKRHSLHWKVSEAPVFYVGYAILIGIAAAITMFSDSHVQGLITQGVQALAGVLLPSATVFLVLLCNDRPVLGPWVNTVKQNIVAGVIVWTLVLLSLSLTATVFFPDLTTSQLVWGFAVGALIGIAGGGLVALRSRRSARSAEIEAAFEGVAPGQVAELDRTPLSAAERKALLQADREAWRTPALSTLSRPPFSPLRKAGLLTLRGYLLMAVILVVVKIVQMAAGH
jgi:hypothetical protein